MNNFPLAINDVWPMYSNQYYIDNNCINATPSVKDLRSLITSDMKWCSHIYCIKSIAMTCSYHDCTCFPTRMCGHCWGCLKLMFVPNSSTILLFGLLMWKKMLFTLNQFKNCLPDKFVIVAVFHLTRSLIVSTNLNLWNMVGLNLALLWLTKIVVV